MDTLLAPLDELESKDLTPENLDTKIPIPNPAYLQKQNSNVSKTENQPLTKYQKEYDLFCEWAAMPKDLRKPKTAVEFERKHLLPKGYTNYFKSREDFSTKRWTAFWDWMLDIYPDVVHAVAQRAISKSDKAAGIIIDLISKKQNLDAPRVQVQPMVLMGIAQDKIDALFVPKGYENVTEAVPVEKKK